MKRTLEPRLKRLETRLVSAQPWHFIINMIHYQGEEQVVRFRGERDWNALSCQEVLAGMEEIWSKLV